MNVNLKFNSLLVLLILTAINPAWAVFDTPKSDFKDNGDGTVTHNKTGLMWQRCSVGQKWTGTTCGGMVEGIGSDLNYDQALKKQGQYFAGYSDWRVPRVDELYSIVEHENLDPSITPAVNYEIFPNTPTNYFWSASPYSSNSGFGWIVDFTLGVNFYSTKAGNAAIRLVRGGQPSLRLGEYTPNDDFIDNKNGTVTHKKTGLTWQRCSVGQTWTDTFCQGTPSRLTEDEAARIAVSMSGGWRLPTQNELKTIVEFKNNTPAINTFIFPNTPLEIFWSKSYSSLSSTAEYELIDFRDGSDTNHTGGNLPLTRLVTSIQPTASSSSSTSTTTNTTTGTGSTVAATTTTSSTGTVTGAVNLQIPKSALNSDLPEFTKNGDGTVTHNPTGLILKACSEGQVWDSSLVTCLDNLGGYTLEESKKITSIFAGQTDWRLPTSVELQSVTEGIKYGLSKNTNFIKPFFPNTKNDFYYSSSSYFYIYDGDRYDAYFDGGNFFDGIYYSKNTYNYSAYYYSKSMRQEAYLHSVRLVRGRQWFGNTLAIGTRVNDFLNNQDGTITHIKTGLTWQRCAVGQTWMDGYCDGFAKTFTQKNAITLTSNLGGNTDWRLPTFEELRTIVDYPVKNPAINKDIFPDAPSGNFWSATSYMGGDKTKAFYVSFSDGYGFYESQDKSYQARLVRGTLSAGNPDLVTTISILNSTIVVNANTTVTATLQNKGTLAATDTKLTFYILKNKMTLVNKPSDCEDKGTTVVCSIGSLESGASVNRAITVSVNTVGGMSLGVSARSNQKDLNQADNTARTTIAIRK
jgi:hypothetical protein